MKKVSMMVSILSLVLFYGCQQDANQQQGAPAALEQSTQQTGQAISVEEDGTQVASEESVQSITQQTATAIQPIEDTSVYEKPTNEQIQTALKNAGIYQGTIDGKIGPKSKEAIKDFQSQNNLVVDGKVGPKTWEKLQPFLNMASQSASAGSDTY